MIDAPLSVTIEDTDDLHPEAEAAVSVIYGSMDVIEVLAETPTTALRGSGWTREDIRLFEHAVQSGHSLLAASDVLEFVDDVTSGAESSRPVSTDLPQRAAQLETGGSSTGREQPAGADTGGTSTTRIRPGASDTGGGTSTGRRVPGGTEAGAAGLGPVQALGALGVGVGVTGLSLADGPFPFGEAAGVSLGRTALAGLGIGVGAGSAAADRTRPPARGRPDSGSLEVSVETPIQVDVEATDTRDLEREMDRELDRAKREAKDEAVREVEKLLSGRTGI